MQLYFSHIMWRHRCAGGLKKFSDTGTFSPLNKFIYSDNTVIGKYKHKNRDFTQVAW